MAIYTTFAALPTHLFKQSKAWILQRGNFACRHQVYYTHLTKMHAICAYINVQVTLYSDMIIRASVTHKSCHSDQLEGVCGMGLTVDYEKT